MRGKKIVALGVLLGVSMLGLFGAAIWATDPDLQGRLCGTAVLLMFVSVPVWGVVGFLND